jgi:NAD(P)-dependent dehydrogenase (short-subunit alcohol dehydrogenase family)
LALELALKITVNAATPGQISESLLDTAEFDPSYGERSTARVPLQHLVTRKEVTELTIQSCLDAFQSVTGVIVCIDGNAKIWRF